VVGEVLGADKVGLVEGRETEGDTVGCTVGECEGLLVVGEVLGLLVDGVVLGADSVGECDGRCVVGGVGARLGAKVGRTVGSLVVGAYEGACEGACESCTSGARVGVAAATDRSHSAQSKSSVYKRREGMAVGWVRNRYVTTVVVQERPLRKPAGLAKLAETPFCYRTRDCQRTTAQRSWRRQLCYEESVSFKSRKNHESQTSSNDPVQPQMFGVL
jgi:hypothetical protein